MRLTAYLTYLTGILHLAVMRILRAVPSACQGRECVRGETRLFWTNRTADSARAEKALCWGLKNLHV